MDILCADSRDDGEELFSSAINGGVGSVYNLPPQSRKGELLVVNTKCCQKVLFVAVCTYSLFGFCFTML